MAKLEKYLFTLEEYQHASHPVLMPVLVALEAGSNASLVEIVSRD